jgi:hypothetical protein
VQSSSEGWPAQCYCCSLVGAGRCSEWSCLPVLEQHFEYVCSAVRGFCKQDLQRVLVRLLYLLVRTTCLQTSSTLVIVYTFVQANCRCDLERRTPGQSDRACHQGVPTAPNAGNCRAALAQPPGAKPSNRCISLHEPYPLQIRTHSCGLALIMSGSCQSTPSDCAPR